MSWLSQRVNDGSLALTNKSAEFCGSETTARRFKKIITDMGYQVVGTKVGVEVYRDGLIYKDTKLIFVRAERGEK